MMWDPVRFLESCPSSDGACAVGLHRPGGWRGGGRRRAGPRRGSSAPRCARSRRSFPGRDPVRPQGAVDCAWRRLRPGRDHRPARADRLRRALRAVQLVRADVARGTRHRRTGRGLEAWSSDGDTELDGAFPVNMSGGVLSSTRSGRRACCGSPRRRCRSAGEPESTRSTGARVALAQAYGATAQYFAMWVVSSSLDPWS